MWLQPPFFSIGVPQLTHGFVVPSISAADCTSSTIFAPYLAVSASRSAGVDLQRIRALNYGKKKQATEGGKGGQPWERALRLARCFAPNRAPPHPSLP